MILSTKLKNAISQKANGMNLQFTLKNVNINGRKMGCNGFIRNLDNGAVVYVTTEDTHCSWLGYMYRYADSERDFKGYSNRWADSLEELATGICRCLKTDGRANDRRI